MQTPADDLERRKRLPKWHQMILPRSATIKAHWGSSRSTVDTRSAERSITKTTAENQRRAGHPPVPVTA